MEFDCCSEKFCLMYNGLMGLCRRGVERRSKKTAMIVLMSVYQGMLRYPICSKQEVEEESVE